MNKTLRLLSILLMTILTLTACSSQSSTPQAGPKESSIFQVAEVENVRVNVESLNVKAGAGNSFRTIATVTKGAVLNVMGKINDWYVVRLDNNMLGCVDIGSVVPVVKDRVPDRAPIQERPQQDHQQPDQNKPQQPPKEQPQQPTPPTQQPQQPTTPRQPQPAPGSNLTSMEQQMVNLVNQERTKNGLPALAVDSQLTKVGRLKAQDMVDNDYFSHYSPTYGSPFDMMDQFNINYLQAGENLAANSSVQKAHTSLMHSSGHRQNILSPDFTHIGIGIKPSKKYGYIFAQEFIGK